MCSAPPAATLVDEEVFGRVYDPRVIRRLVPYVMPYRHLTAVATVAMLVYVGTQVAIPWIIKTGIDGYIGVEGGGDFGGLALVFAIFMASALLNWAANFTMQTAMARAGQGVLYDIRSKLFRHLQKLSLRFFDKTEVGRIMSRVQGDVWQLQEFMSLAVMTLGDLLSLVGIVIALLLMNVELGLVTIGRAARADRDHGRSGRCTPAGRSCASGRRYRSSTAPSTRTSPGCVSYRA